MGPHALLLAVPPFLATIQEAGLTPEALQAVETCGQRAVQGQAWPSTASGLGL